MVANNTIFIVMCAKYFLFDHLKLLCSVSPCPVAHNFQKMINGVGFFLPYFSMNSVNGKFQKIIR